MTEVKKWTPFVLAKLHKKLGRKTNDFITLLKATGAIISGGFVLRSIKKYTSDPDLDIYVPFDKMPEFLDKLIVQKMFEFRLYRHYDATIYCRSFLRKNGIKRVHTFKGENLMMDIMSVRKRKTPQDVCSNFDLTYCQVWFDGTTVFATHPSHIENKKGYLQGDYIEPFIKGNVFLNDRLKKYRKHGFTTDYDESIESLPSIDLIISSAICVEQKYNDILPVWFKKVATRWLTSTNKSEFVVPFGTDTQYMPQGDENICSDAITAKFHGTEIEEFKIPDDEGYDSDDMDTDKLIALANGDESNDELVYRRSMFNLLRHLFTDTGNLFFFNFYHILYDEETKVYNPEKYQPYADYLRNNCTRVGEDMFGDDGILYDIHSHPMDGAITADSMESYLQQFYSLSDDDKSKGMPCYYKPELDDHPNNCKKQITLKEIQTIISNDVYAIFTKPEPIKLGLNTAMPFYEAALTNVKTEEKGYGMEFHESMCPFCLLPVSRGSGCSYMTHENPKKLSESETPYCKKEFIVESMIEKYRKMAPIIDISYTRGLPINIQFCVECGRPCLGHQHFDITSAMPKLVPPKKKPDPDKPGNMIFDYATCAGGGRIELIARILAVRDVYKYSLIKDPVKERVKAAFAADKAPNMKSYVDRATAILNMELKDRKFNTKIKFVKKYNDPTYKDVIEEKSLSKSINDVARAAYDQLAHEIENQENEENEENEENQENEEKEGIEVNSSIENDMKEENQNDIPDENQNSENNVNNLMWGNREGGGRKKTNKNIFKYIRKLKNKTYKLRKRQ